MKLLALLARLLLAVVLVVSGGFKVAAPDRFLLDLQSFQLLPYAAAYVTALLLPWLEIFAGIALWLPSLRRGASLLALLMFLSFIAALGWAELQGLDLDCGCFGAWQPFPNFGLHAAFNSLLAASAVLLLRKDSLPPKGTYL